MPDEQLCNKGQNMSVKVMRQFILLSRTMLSNRPFNAELHSPIDVVVNITASLDTQVMFEITPCPNFSQNFQVPNIIFLSFWKTLTGPLSESSSQNVLTIVNGS